MFTEPELRQLRTFVTVAEELHFTRAAERLHMAQQSLSAQIRSLEARLDVQLFDRTTRRVELTEAGRTLLSHAIPLLAAATRAWEEVSCTAVGEGGQLSVSYAPTARQHVLPELLAEVRRLYPRLEIKSCELWWGRAAITSGLADIAIIRGPVPDDPEIDGATLLESALGIVLGTSHRLAGSKSIRVEQLTGSVLEIPARRFTPGFHDVILDSLRSQGFDGEVVEYENLGSRHLLDDEAACARICSGKAFGVGFENQYTDMPAGLLWIPISPELLVPMTICWQERGGAAVHNFVAAALDVAHRRGWLGSGPTANASRQAFSGLRGWS